MDIRDKIQVELQDEIKAKDEYTELAAEADAAGLHEAASSIRGIADDEGRHRKILTEILQGADNPEAECLVLHVLEHVVVGGGRVVDPMKARSTPCKCFHYEGETFCWSPGILGLISSKKNPDGIEQYCALGQIAAGEGMQKRFARIKSAVDKAHEEYEKSGGTGMVDWWTKVGGELAQAGVKF